MAPSSRKRHLALAACAALLLLSVAKTAAGATSCAEHGLCAELKTVPVPAVCTAALRQKIAWGASTAGTSRTALAVPAGRHVERSTYQRLPHAVSVTLSANCPCYLPLLSRLSAAYQIEGGWNEGGRTPSVWDNWSQTPGRVYKNQTGNVRWLQQALYARTSLPARPCCCANKVHANFPPSK